MWRCSTRGSLARVSGSAVASSAPRLNSSFWTRRSAPGAAPPATPRAPRSRAEGRVRLVDGAVTVEPERRLRPARRRSARSGPGHRRGCRRDRSAYPCVTRSLTACTRWSPPDLISRRHAVCSVCRELSLVQGAGMMPRSSRPSPPGVQCAESDRRAAPRCSPMWSSSREHGSSHSIRGSRGGTSAGRSTPASQRLSRAREDVVTGSAHTAGGGRHPAGSSSLGGAQRAAEGPHAPRPRSCHAGGSSARRTRAVRAGARRDLFDQQVLVLERHVASSVDHHAALGTRRAACARGILEERVELHAEARRERAAS